MVVRIRWSKVIALILFALAIICFFHRPQNDAVQTVMSAFKEQSPENKVLVYLFADAIQEQSDLFYEPYYTISPTVAYYSTYVKWVKDIGTNTQIAFSSLPYIGPHDTIGEDEIIFQVNPNGEIVPIKFRHLASYPLPDNLISIQKELPPAG